MRTVVFILTIFIFSSCQDRVFTPKPRAFPRIIYPDRSYKDFSESYCNFSFDYPGYGLIQKDTLFFDKKPNHECWFDINLPPFDGKIHCSFSNINREFTFEKLRQDAFELAYKHNMRADFIEEFAIERDNQVSGFLFSLEGPSASPLQFYLSDSTSQFLRGALYFNTSARPDSLAPVIEFVREDILRMIETFEWN